MTEYTGGAEIISSLHVRHIMRYQNACNYLDKSMNILDAACGTGYGTDILSRHCRRVIGVDSDIEALRESRKNYNHLFLEANLLKTSFGGQDAIVSIETLEHFSEEDGETLLQNFHNWLLPKGILIISTPYCLMSGPSPVTTTHLWEYSLTDFDRTLSNTGFRIETIELQQHEGAYGRRGYLMAKATK